MMGEPVQLGAREVVTNELIEDSAMGRASVFAFIAEKMLNDLYTKAEAEGIRVESWRMDMGPHKPTRDDMYRSDFAMHTTDISLIVKGTQL